MSPPIRIHKKNIEFFYSFAFMNAFGKYFKALPFLFEHKLASFLFYPLIITALIIWGGAELASWATDLVTEQMNAWFDDYAWLPTWAEWIADVFYWIIWILFRIALYFAMAFLGGSFILILMSPILTYLSEQVASKLGKDIPPFSLIQFVVDLTRAIGLGIKNGFIQIALTIACFAISFIPVIGFISPFLIFGINAYFFGYQFMDYTLERRHLTISESNTFVWSKKFDALSLGVPFTAWLLIPFIGPMTSGFMAILATVAATLHLEES